MLDFGLGKVINKLEKEIEELKDKNERLEKIANGLLEVNDDLQLIISEYERKLGL